MVRSAPLLAILLLAAGTSCARPDTLSTRTVSINEPAPGQQAEVPEPSPESAMQTTWNFTYSDGANNRYTISRATPEAPASFVYDPVTAAESSSGLYDGGPPAAGELSEAQVEALWRELLALRTDTDRHAEQRTKGSGAISWDSPAGEVAFLVRMGAAEGLERLLDELRGSGTQ